MNRFLPILLPLLLLAACAPAVTGSSARQPQRLSNSVIEVVPGQTLYVLSVNTLAELGFNEGDLEAVLFVNETADRASARADNWMGVTPVRVPAWWNVGLSTSRFVTERTVQTTVQSVIRIDIPTNAQLGGTELLLDLDGRRSSTSVRVQLRVRQH